MISCLIFLFFAGSSLNQYVCHYKKFLIFLRFINDSVYVNLTISWEVREGCIYHIPRSMLQGPKMVHVLTTCHLYMLRENLF